MFRPQVSSHAIPLMILLLASGACLADSVNNWEEMREQQRKENDAMMENIPILEKTRVQDVMQVRMESRVLTVRTPLATTRAAGFVRCKLGGMNQFALIRVQGGSDSESGDAVVPTNLQFNLTDYSRPRQICTLAVTTQVTFVNISKSLQFPVGYQHIQLMEQNGLDGSGQPGAITLAVNESSPADGAPINLSLEAEDFFTFLRRYPQESERYIRPLLRELGQESVFAPDPLIAWQVFSYLWEPHSAVSKHVNDLLPDLDASDFHDRQRALLSLQSLGRDGAAVMVHLDRARLSAEQNARIDRALAPYTQLPPREAIGLRSQTSFLLDCLYCEDVLLRRSALKRLREIVGPQLQFDVDADPETRSLAIVRLRGTLVGAAQ